MNGMELGGINGVRTLIRMDHAIKDTGIILQRQNGNLGEHITR